jgi:hypothetical protein
MNDEQKKYLYYAIPIVVVIALGGALYYGKRQKEEAAVPQSAAQTPVDPGAATAPEHHPIETAPSEPLPTLAESDPTVQQSLEQLFGRGLGQYLVPKDIVRHAVVTIDNLPRKKNAPQMWPVKPLGGEFRTSSGNELMLNESNYDRYKAIVNLATATDTQQLVAVYKRFYPLFQQSRLSGRLLQQSPRRGDRSSARNTGGRRSGKTRAAGRVL